MTTLYSSTLWLLDPSRKLGYGGVLRAVCKLWRQCFPEVNEAESIYYLVTMGKRFRAHDAAAVLFALQIDPECKLFRPTYHEGLKCITKELTVLAPLEMVKQIYAGITDLEIYELFDDWTLFFDARVSTLQWKLGKTSSRHRSYMMYYIRSDADVQKLLDAGYDFGDVSIQNIMRCAIHTDTICECRTNNLTHRAYQAIYEAPHTDYHEIHLARTKSPPSEVSALAAMIYTMVFRDYPRLRSLLEIYGDYSEYNALMEMATSVGDETVKNMIREFYDEPSLMVRWL